ncbi:MAG: zinc ABC transporter substrate-binding protein [Litorilinea sp.]
MSDTLSNQLTHHADHRLLSMNLRGASLRPLLTLLVLLGVLLIAGCGGNSQAAGSNGDTNDTNGEAPLQVVTTIAQIADAAQIIGGEHAQVIPLMGPGIDPHLYTASEGDVDRLRNADIIFYNGLFLEANMADILEQLGENKTVVAVAAQIDESRLLPWAAYEDAYDPHVWFDVTLWMTAVEAIRDTYIAQDPDHAEEYTANAAAYLAELEELHAYVLSQAERLTPAQRTLVTAHDAFHYFGIAYGFEVQGLQGISTATEAGAADVREMADLIVERQVPAIFIESSVPIRNVEAMQAAVRSQGFEVVIGGEIFSDAMGEAGTPEGTYIGMVRHNIDTIVGALLGEE